VPECFEAFNQAMGGPNGVAFVEVVRAEILVGGAPLQHIVAGGKDGTGHSDQRPLGTAQRRQAAELRLQVRPFAFGGGPSSFAQGSAEPGIPTARGAALPFPGGLVVAGTNACPTHHVGRRRKGFYRGTNFGDQGPGQAMFDARTVSHRLTAS